MDAGRGSLVAGADDPADDAADDGSAERDESVAFVMRGGISRRGGRCWSRLMMRDGLGMMHRLRIVVADFLRRVASVVAATLSRSLGFLMLRRIVASAIVVVAAVAARGGRRRSAKRRAEERGRHEFDRFLHCRVLVHVAPTFLA